MNERNKIKENLTIALFSALMAVGAFIRIPIGPIPISLTSFFVILAAMLLGAKRSVFSVIIYLIAGVAGLPVFSGGSGPSVFVGPTGGFLLAYLPAAFICGLISSNTEKASSVKIPVADIFAVIAGTILLYLIGVPWLQWRLDFGWVTAFSVGMLPFLPGDAVKAVSAILIRQLLLRHTKDLLPVR